MGGEYYGDRNQALGDRFEKYFSCPLTELLDLNAYLRVAKLDLDYQTSFYNSVKRKYVRRLIDELENSSGGGGGDRSKDRYHIILNHMTLLNRNTMELKAVRMKRE